MDARRGKMRRGAASSLASTWAPNRRDGSRRSGRDNESELADKCVPSAQVAEIQRSRLLAGAIRSLDELGYQETTVAQITSRSRISRRTFYELFANREECLVAVLDESVAMLERELAVAGLEGVPWRERMRIGLWTVLSFLDRDPALARVCVVQALQAGPNVLEHRERGLARLSAAIDEGRRENPRAEQLTVLTAEGLVGAALSILSSRLLRRQGTPLTDLHGELLGMILLPYLGAATARRVRSASAPPRTHNAAPNAADIGLSESDPLEGVPMRLTYRTARVLECALANPGASNRKLADYAGITDQGQISKLLSRLERLGLLSNAAVAQIKGEPNIWTLTSTGERIAHSLRLDARARKRVAL